MQTKTIELTITGELLIIAYNRAIEVRIEAAYEKYGDKAHPYYYEAESFWDRDTRTKGYLLCNPITPSLVVNITTNGGKNVYPSVTYTQVAVTVNGWVNGCEEEFIKAFEEALSELMNRPITFG